MPIEEIQQTIGNEEEKDLLLQYCGEDPMTIVVELAEAAKEGHLATVTSLDLGGNAMDATAMEALGDMVLPHMPLLDFIDLRHNELGAEGVAALRSALPKSCPKLLTITVSENKLQDAGAREALLLMLDMPGVTKLLLGSNGLTPQICPMVAKAIMSQKTRCLEMLCLEYNSFGDEGTVLLMRGLIGAKIALRNLTLSDNCIGDAGVVQGIVPFLMSPNQVLEVLDLSVNKIGAKGAKELAVALRHRSCQVRELDMGCNPITEAGAIPLVQAAARKCQLLDLTSTDMTMKVMDELKQGVRQNPQFRHIETGNNEEVPDAVHKELHDLTEELQFGMPPNDTTPNGKTSHAKGPSFGTICAGAAVALAVAGIAGLYIARSRSNA
jgi:Ran GTPase-activating protein (RanGAP) involved in mRNA processing and transport